MTIIILILFYLFKIKKKIFISNYFNILYIYFIINLNKIFYFLKFCIYISNKKKIILNLYYLYIFQIQNS